MILPVAQAPALEQTSFGGKKRQTVNITTSITIIIHHIFLIFLVCYLLVSSLLLSFAPRCRLVFAHMFTSYHIFTI